MRSPDPASSVTNLNVSDTAYWIAAFRAEESARSDALFHDPYAKQLAGPSERWPRHGVPSWPLVARTKLIDDLIAQTLADGADRVLNLAAGLDTRPYRLQLPGSLRWIEADLASVIEYKTCALEGAVAHCELRREAVDLSNRDARSKFLDDALRGAKRAVAITEGLLLYLESSVVEELARDLAARPELAHWIIDIASPTTLRDMQRTTNRQLAPDSRMRFAPAQGVGFFRKLGWKPREVHSLLKAAARWKRAPWPLRLVARLPEADPENPGRRRWGAAIWLERVAQ